MQVTRGSSYLMFLSLFLTIVELSDHSKGFGGKFGVEHDKQDASAVGWEHKEVVEKHESQTGSCFFSSRSIHVRQSIINVRCKKNSNI